MSYVSLSLSLACIRLALKLLTVPEWRTFGVRRFGDNATLSPCLEG